MQAHFRSLEVDGAVLNLLTVNHGMKAEVLNNYLCHPYGPNKSRHVVLISLELNLQHSVK